MPNPGTVTLMGNLIVSWTFDSGKSTLTVTATLDNKSFDSTVLTPSHQNDQLTVTAGGNTATAKLHADFTTHVLSIDASETDGSKSAVTNTSF